MTTKAEVLGNWFDTYVYDGEPIPLFETDTDGVVQTKPHGLDDRPILKRHPQMEELVKTEGQKVIDDWEGADDTYEGIIYMMYTLREGEIIPYYVGKAGKYGRDGERLSANLTNIQTNTNKFARWGDGYAYHIGELSAVVLNHYEDESVDHDTAPKGKYQKWADQLFDAETRTLSDPVYFWARAWSYDDTGPFYDFETSLEALEYNLISLSADLYPDALLNDEGA